VVGPCEHGHENLGSMKGGNFLTSSASVPRRTLLRGFRSVSSAL
jgi:hypothetical protein